jgi:hypothetical protein
LHGKAVRGERVERVASTKGQAWAEASSNRGLHSCTKGAWVLLDRSCTFGPPGTIRRVRSLSAPPVLATAFIALREHTDPARNAYPRIPQSGKQRLFGPVGR